MGKDLFPYYFKGMLSRSDIKELRPERKIDRSGQIERRNVSVSEKKNSCDVSYDLCEILVIPNFIPNEISRNISKLQSHMNLHVFFAPI